MPQTWEEGVLGLPEHCPEAELPLVYRTVMGGGQEAAVPGSALEGIWKTMKSKGQEKALLTRLPGCQCTH